MATKLNIVVKLETVNLPKDSTECFKEDSSFIDGSESVKNGATFNLGRHIFVILLGTSFIFGWCIGALNQPSEHIKEFFNKSYTERYGKVSSKFTVTTLWSLTNAVIFPAGMVGALFSSLPSDRLGRKRAIFVSHVPTIAGCILQLISVPVKLPELLIIGRFIQGIGNGMYAALCPTYLTEIAPLRLRGAVGSMYQCSYSFGILVSSILGLNEVLGTSALWHYITPLSLIPVIISAVLMPHFPDSPRYLMLCKQDKNKAAKALRFLRQATDVSEDISEMSAEAKEGVKKNKITFFGMMKTPHLRNPLIIVCCLQVMKALTGISVILFYSMTIFKSAGLSPSNVQYAVVVINAVYVIMSVIGAGLIDRVGRRPMLLVPLAVMILNLAILLLGMKLQEYHILASYFSVIASLIFVGAFAIGLGNVTVLVGAEMFRQGPRALAMSCAGITNWFFFFVVMMSFELIQTVLEEMSLLIFLIASLFWLIFIYFKVPETKHRTFEEIANAFDKKENELMQDVES